MIDITQCCICTACTHVHVVWVYISNRSPSFNSIYAKLNMYYIVSCEWYRCIYSVYIFMYYECILALYLLSSIASMVSSICWNDQYNILATTQDKHLVMWYHPAVVFTDKDLLHQTSVNKQKRFFTWQSKFVCECYYQWISGYPKHPQVVSFIGNHCTLRRSDGALVRTQWVVVRRGGGGDMYYNWWGILAWVILWTCTMCTCMPIYSACIGSCVCICCNWSNYV